jgi:NitT/TauT family transport system ATP-binding protein
MAEKNAQNHSYREYPTEGSQDFPRRGLGSYGDVHHKDERAIAMAAIELRSVTKKFATADGGTFTALKDISFTVEDGQFCAVVGPTGCGKSTTLTLISGLESPSAGEAFVDGKAVSGIDTGTGFVFQQDAIFPWKSVLDNVSAGPLFRGMDKADARAQANDWIRRVGLSGFEDRYPHQLSGGMRKRVALAQTLINRPRVLLMDEPFGALDVQTRSIMSTELLNLWDQTKPAVVFVTHDLEEAIALADKVIVLTAGPGTVKAEFHIDLPRPRVVQEIRFDPRFVATYERIWEALRDEVQEAYARTTTSGATPLALDVA